MTERELTSSPAPPRPRSISHPPHWTLWEVLARPLQLSYQKRPEPFTLVDFIAKPAPLEPLWFASGTVQLDDNHLCSTGSFT